MLRKENLLLCDLTQSWSEFGGGISTYLRQKRNYIKQFTDYRHLLIVPGKEDRVTREGRLIFAEVAGPPVPQSQNYRFLLNNRSVMKVLQRFQPDVIESLDPYNLPWAAISHRKKYQQTALVAGYRTDFPNAHIRRVTDNILGKSVGKAFRDLSYRYAGMLYRRFDMVYTLNETMRHKLTQLGTGPVETLPLGVDLSIFNPSRRDLNWRQQLGVAPHQPLLVYAGRIDVEKRTEVLLGAFKLLPLDMNAHLLMLGVGKSMEGLKQRAHGLNVHFPGYESDRDGLAIKLASSDIYVSAMPDETFGISIVEAQASGLPIVGVNSGAMPDRVPFGTGLLGPVDDAEAMARNIETIWNGPTKSMGEAGRKIVVDSFSWDHCFRQLFGNIYPKAIAAREQEFPPAATQPILMREFR